MATRSGKPSGGNPYKILYWFGAGIVLLLGGVLYFALAMQPARGPVRTAVWLTRPGAPAGQRPDMILLIEEPRDKSGTRMVMLPARMAAGTFVPVPGQGKSAMQELAAALGYQVQNYLVLTDDVLARILSHAPQLELDGVRRSARETVNHAFSPADPRERMRLMAEVLNQLAAHGAAGRFAMSAGEGMDLFDRIEGNLPMLYLAGKVPQWLLSGPLPLHPAPGEPDAEGNWQLDAAGLAAILRPDPPPKGARSNRGRGWSLPASAFPLPC